MARRSGSRKKSRKSSNNVLSWWPVVLGLALTPFTAKIASYLALAGPWPLRVVYPSSMLARQPLLGLAAPTIESFSLWLMYVQFPVEGFFFRLLQRRRSFLFALVVLSAIHIAIVCLLHWLFASSTLKTF